MRVRKFLAPLLCVLIAGGAAVLAQEAGRQDSQQQVENPLEFNPVKGRVGLRWKPIADAPFIRAAEVTDQVAPEELVLGVVVNEQARAYPINMLSGPSREIINDMVGGRAIAATW